MVFRNYCVLAATEQAGIDEQAFAPRLSNDKGQSPILNEESNPTSFHLNTFAGFLFIFARD
jgi:hypothetical protein